MLTLARTRLNRFNGVRTTSACQIVNANPFLVGVGDNKVLLVSISSTIYEQLLRQYSCAEKLQSQTASTKSFQHKNIGAKAARKNVDEIDTWMTMEDTAML